jgi:beta-glucosidase
MPSEDGFAYRDLNENGRLDLYEDSRRPIEERVEDLLSKMTLEEKAGMMFHTMVGMNEDGSLLEEAGPMNPAPTSDLLAGRFMNHFNVYAVAAPRQMAEWLNRLQKLAERTRLGIPVTISSDPRHAYSKDEEESNLTSFMMSGGFSQWPGPIGLAAIGDPALVKEFGDIARQEYLAVGIRVALHPMADLATEPRWARIQGTFGEDAKLASRIVSAYIEGFQGDTFGPESVACMTKHFPGGGPQKDGEDPHFSYGKEQVYPGDNFDYHLTPFEAAFEAGTAQIMPYYGMPVGLAVEEVACPEVVVGLVRSGLIQEARIDESIRRLLRDKFRLGLFDDPYVDPETAERVVGSDAFRRAGEVAQRRSIVLLKNAETDYGRFLPIRGRPKIYVENLDPGVAGEYGRVVESVEDADVAILRLSAPFEPREGFLERHFNAGDLDFKDEEKAHILDVLGKVPTVVDIYLERPAVIPEIADRSAGLLADFGACDAAVLDVIFGRFKPSGKLPFEMPSSMDAVRRQKEDVPHDSEDPLFTFGYGLTY